MFWTFRPKGIIFLSCSCPFGQVTLLGGHLNKATKSPKRTDPYHIFVSSIFDCGTGPDIPIQNGLSGPSLQSRRSLI